MAGAKVAEALAAVELAVAGPAARTVAAGLQVAVMAVVVYRVQHPPRKRSHVRQSSFPSRCTRPIVQPLRSRAQGGRRSEGPWQPVRL